ncbi:multicopper oxidase domain-containing protein [Gramella sp. AN32]|uniref:Multicopper oxidase family protein n=1 Tax=Christiangramia antarctica TaxID=2058158 RepID=A0ABW5X3C0_9FLAO|nr:multicopper oxidase domain-containing protein [Gramella sp. AN32]MCM4158149.1 bilirubin oxidase [Gramella sp. AN32]
MVIKKNDRRNFIKLGCAGASMLIAWPLFQSCANEKNNSDPLKMNPNFQPDLDIKLIAREIEIGLFEGEKTQCWAFGSELIKGNPDSLRQIPNSYLGPIIKVRKGQKIRVRFKNELPQKSIVHWHGMHVPEEYDGHPKNIISEGQTYVYEYEVMNRAGTYWFHPHPHGKTGEQVYNGLAGMLLVSDGEEENLGLPKDEFDLPVVIQDRSIDTDNQLVYLDGGRMDSMMGFLGDRIFVNGRPEQELSLKAGCNYRLRILNGSNSRIYKLAWHNGEPLKVIGIDGSILERTKTMPYVILAPAKRIDIWLDLKNKKQGEELELKSLEFESGMMGGMMNGGMMGGSNSHLPLGSEYSLFKIKLNKSGSNEYLLPEKLIPYNKLDPTTAINQNNPREFNFFMQGMQWTINGRTWETTDVAEEEIVKINTTEIWQLSNRGGKMMGGGGMMGNGGMMGRGNKGGGMGNMMQMPHPIHIHQVQFNILERDTSEMDINVWNSIREGIIDEGWQDTVLLMPGMKIKIIMRFSDFKGLFVYHCHNLEHEDMGMMRNYKIE